MGHETRQGGIEFSGPGDVSIGGDAVGETKTTEISTGQFPYVDKDLITGYGQSATEVETLDQGDIRITEFQYAKTDGMCVRKVIEVYPVDRSFSPGVVSLGSSDVVIAGDVSQSDLTISTTPTTKSVAFQSQVTLNGRQVNARVHYSYSLIGPDELEDLAKRSTKAFDDGDPYPDSSEIEPIVRRYFPDAKLLGQKEQSNSFTPLKLVEGRIRDDDNKVLKVPKVQ